ncbi:hypothetical protein PIB30_036520 [Stylosanthes scabra]|uniref:RRM domain-containing protein n=1 Tax=Stylosanthes scabra TaxID=79078 RepID=A0ABU6RDL6_9FABA|nr:hypothetical protein [Stylosanthes scabra]
MSVGNTVRHPVMPDEEIRGRVWGGGFAPGVGRMGLRGVGNEPHTIFVDGLTKRTMKRMLYVKFGKFGYIMDVCISKKLRAKASGPYAFIRYKNRSGVVDAIRMLNGTMWDNNNLVVTMSKFERNGGFNRRMVHDRKLQLGGREKKATQKWVEVRRRTIVGVGGDGLRETTTSMEKTRRKEVRGIWADEQ